MKNLEPCDVLGYKLLGVKKGHFCFRLSLILFTPFPGPESVQARAGSMLRRTDGEEARGGQESAGRQEEVVKRQEKDTKAVVK